MRHPSHSAPNARAAGDGLAFAVARQIVVAAAALQVQRAIPYGLFAEVIGARAGGNDGGVAVHAAELRELRRRQRDVIVDPHGLQVAQRSIL